MKREDKGRWLLEKMSKNACTAFSFGTLYDVEIMQRELKKIASDYAVGDDSEKLKAIDNACDVVQKDIIDDIFCDII